MNTRSIIFNLDEALEQLNSTLNDLRNTKDYNEDDFRVQIEHLYHHINFAWNTRHEPDEQVVACAQEDFYRWRVFPQDIDLSDINVSEPK